MDTSTTPPTPADVGPTDRGDLLRAVLVALLAAVIVFVAVVGFVTLLTTSSTLTAVRAGQQLHGATINHIDHVAKVDAAELAKLKAATMTVDKILAEAGATSAELLANQHAICVALGAAC